MSDSHVMLKQFIAQNQASCPFCNTSLTDTTACPNCREVMKLGIVKHDDRTDLAFNRRWRILILPWFLMCYMAASHWATVIGGIVLREGSLGNFFGLPRMEFMPILGFLTGWLELMSPIICILMWRFRSRINCLPAWLIWTVFGVGVVFWIQILLWPLSMLL